MVTEEISPTIRTITLLIVVCLVSFPAQAKYSGGRGVPDDPYQIATATDLIALGETPDDYDKHFVLTADIDLDPNLPGRKVFDKAVIAPDVNDTEYGFQGTSFTGVFDGNDHTISHLTIEGKDSVGLFGILDSGAEVKDLGVVDVNIASSGEGVGGLAALVEGGKSAVTRCYTTGAVQAESIVGGLVGINFGDLAQCHSTAAVSSGRGVVGGLVGMNAGIVAQCYSTGAVTGNLYAGGLVGNNDWTSMDGMTYGGAVTTSYSTGDVIGKEHVGGLVGDNSYGDSITHSYSTGVVSGTGINVGGLVGSGGATASFWDTQTSGQTTSAGGLGLTTAEMMDPQMFALNGWANDPNWVLDAGRDYPRLVWEGTPGQVIPEPRIDWLEGQGTPKDPYRVDTADQLILLGKASILWDKHFVLGADINLDPNLPNVPVFAQAVVPRFTGVFDGNGYAISHLTIRGKDYLGLFGQLGGWDAPACEVKNLGVVDVNITGSGDYIGGLVGDNDGSIANCYSNGSVSGTGRFVGGLAGMNFDGIIDTSYSTGTVRGGSDVGGLVGSNRGVVTRCYSTGMVSGDYGVGGLVGCNYDTVTDCYSRGAVSATATIMAWPTGHAYASGGGLVGVNLGAVTYCYSAGAVTGSGSADAGFVGYHGSNGRVNHCFWDTQSSGQTESAGGVGKTTAEMQTAKTFLDAGWDFVGETANGTQDIWWILEGKDYPRLWWEAQNN